MSKVVSYLENFILFLTSNIFHILTLVIVTSIYMFFVHSQGETDKEINALRNQYNASMQEVKLLQDKDSITDRAIEHLSAETGSRFTIIESTIEGAKKKRALVIQIRDAITESTNTVISLDQLNGIAYSVIYFSYLHNLSIADVLAQIRIESNFVINAQSEDDAQGLMQIIPQTQRYIAGELNKRKYSIWKIRTNIHFGCFYMSEVLTEMRNDYDDALRAYNFGPHNVKKVKLGLSDYSLHKIEVVDGEEVKFLVDNRGKYILDDMGNKRIVQLEDKYPAETRGYIKQFHIWQPFFASRGLDKQE